MAIIPQITLFEGIEYENLGDLERLKLVLNYMPDEELMRKLEEKRGNGRDDYPIRAMWNCLIAGIIFQHKGESSLLRELGRNSQLRVITGFAGRKLPESYNYSRFLKNLLECNEEIEKMFDTVLKEITELLPDFGQRLAGDGKAIQSFATGKNKNSEKDGRRDLDADKGVKKYSGVDENGKAWEKITTWFGYKLHLIVDAIYELPIAYEVTKASAGENPEMKKLIREVAKNNPEIMERCEVFTADRGYDDTEIITDLWDEHKVKAVIDIRNCWQDKDEIRMFENRQNIIGYDNFGTIYCYCPESGKRREMSFSGFEKDRESLKYTCPCKAYGVQCEGCKTCPYANKSVRIKMEEDPRRFTAIARSSHKWNREYDIRTSVERVNSRIDNAYGFEKHYIRGKKKMKLRVGLSLLIMLVMALGRIKEKQPERMRSLVARVS